MSKQKSGMWIAMQDEPLPAQKEPETTAAPAEEPSRPRQGNQPICPIHDVQMVAYSTGSIFTYYRCPQEKCRETAKRLRPIGPVKNLYGNGKSARK